MTRWLHPPSEDTAARTVAAAFAQAYGRAPEGVWAAPGRVNLIGEHTDYNAGLCLPIALPHKTFVAAGRTEGVGLLRLRSAQASKPWEGGLDAAGPGQVGGWAAYAAGVVWALHEEGGWPNDAGLDAAIDGQVPLGAGLSSSAALSGAIAVAAHSLGGSGRDPVDSERARLAAICVRAENEVAGAPTGGMDQAAALRCTAGHALLLDCRDGSVEQVPFELAAQELSLLVIDTNAPHRLVDGQYASRRSGCEAAARALGVESLRAVEPSDLDAALGQLPDEELVRLVRHVVTENERVRVVVRLLRAGRAGDLGPVLDASHASLRDDYRVTVPELDVAVDAARDAGAIGARMTGGGFGGSAIALTPAGLEETVASRVEAAFRAAGFASPAFLLAPASAGAGRVTGWAGAPSGPNLRTLTS